MLTTPPIDNNTNRIPALKVCELGAYQTLLFYFPDSGTLVKALQESKIARSYETPVLGDSKRALGLLQPAGCQTGT